MVGRLEKVTSRLLEPVHRSKINVNMYVSGAVRRNLTTSVFYATGLISVLTVTAPTLFPCPVSHGVGADAPETPEKEVDFKN